MYSPKTLFTGVLVAVTLLGNSCLPSAPNTPQVPSAPVSHPSLRNLNVSTNQELTLPFVLTGEARGTWYFEASFPVRLEDMNGNLLQQTYAMAQGEWMTEDFVPFQSQALHPENLSVTQGILVIEKDNPSGLPEFADEVRVPVRFAL